MKIRHLFLLLPAAVGLTLNAGQSFRQPTAAEVSAAAIPELQSPAQLRVAGPMRVGCRVILRDGAAVAGEFAVPPVTSQRHTDRLERLPLFDARQWGWNKGAQLKGSVHYGIGRLDGDSVTVRNTATGQAYQPGKDFKVDRGWAAVGRLDGGAIAADTPVTIDYRITEKRLDSIFLKDGALMFRAGGETKYVPRLPDGGLGAVRIANIAWQGGEKELTADQFFPIQERYFPVTEEPVADELLPRTMKKLREGGPLKVLAWGDSVTEGYWDLGRERGWSDRWQEQFVRRLGARFPRARIVLTTEGWGGRSTVDYLKTAPGDKHDYRSKVLAVKPDLLVMEFINDSQLSEKDFARYERILADLRGANPEMEVICCLPHQTSEMVNTDGGDPRPYIRLLRSFCERNRLAWADVSHRYSRVWRLGIPAMLLMVNNHNHPLADGMKIYADALMALFPEK